MALVCENRNAMVLGYYSIISIYEVLNNINTTRTEYIDSMRLFVIIDIMISHIFLIVVILTLYFNNTMSWHTRLYIPIDCNVKILPFCVLSRHGERFASVVKKNSPTCSI